VPCAPARGRGVSRACLTHAVRLRGRAQIETLAGQVLAAEVDSSASLAAMRAGIQRETGVLAEQQRFIILGAPLMRAELAGAGGCAGTLLAAGRTFSYRKRALRHLRLVE